MCTHIIYIYNHLLCVLCIMICILSSRSNPYCVCVFSPSPICMPLCRARIFCCCCSSSEVRAFTCFSVSSNTTAFSRWPRVYGRDTHCQHFFMSNYVHTLTQLSSGVALYTNDDKVNNNNSGTTLKSLYETYYNRNSEFVIADFQLHSFFDIYKTCQAHLI